MLLLPALLESFRTLKDKTLKVQFETQELTPNEFAELSESLQQFGYLAFKKEPFRKEEINAIQDLQTELETGKTPSQRLRGVLYRMYEQDAQGFKSFTTFYEHQLEIIINHFKTKIK
jgi:hypothetical protein